MQQSVEQSISRMVQAWNAGDAAAYADEFTEDATYVIFAVGVSRGRAEIRRDHEPVLTRFRKGSRMRVEVTDTHDLGDDVRVVISEGGVGTGRSIPLNKVQTFVFRRQADGRWLCAAFHNTSKHRLMMWLARRSTSSPSGR